MDHWIDNAARAVASDDALSRRAVLGRVVKAVAAGTAFGGAVGLVGVRSAAGQDGGPCSRAATRQCDDLVNEGHRTTRGYCAFRHPFDKQLRDACYEEAATVARKERLECYEKGGENIPPPCPDEYFCCSSAHSNCERGRCTKPQRVRA